MYPTKHLLVFISCSAWCMGACKCGWNNEVYNKLCALLFVKTWSFLKCSHNYAHFILSVYICLNIHIYVYNYVCACACVCMHAIRLDSVKLPSTVQLHDLSYVHKITIATCCCVASCCH